MTVNLGAAMDIRFGVTIEQFMNYVTDIGLNHVEFKHEYLAGHPNTPNPTQIRDLANRYNVSLTYHAPFRNWNIGSYDDVVWQDSVERVKRTLDDANEAGAAAVVIHGGSVPNRYPEWIQDTANKNARRALAACAEYAQLVGIPLCLENQPLDDRKRRHTTSPDDLKSMIDFVDVPPQYLGVTLDVGHAKVNGYDWKVFTDTFGDRIKICHLHDNDGTADQHQPLFEYDSIVDAIPADYFVFETKSVVDVGKTVGAGQKPPKPEVSESD